MVGKVSFFLFAEATSGSPLCLTGFALCCAVKCVFVLLGLVGIIHRGTFYSAAVGTVTFLV